MNSGAGVFADPADPSAPALPLRATPAGQRIAGEIGYALGAVALSTAAALLLRRHVAASNLVLLYLLGVVAVAARRSRMASIAASLLSVAAFDFFCVPPYLTFRVHDDEFLITFPAMLAVALVISAQTARIRAQAEHAAAREARSEALYRLSRRLAGQTRAFDVARIAAEFLEEAFQRQAVIFLPEEGRISFARRSSDALTLPRAEEQAAQWTLDHGEKAGAGTPLFGASTALYLPLKGARETVAVMALLADSDGPAGSSQTALLEMFAQQIASAIERARSQNIAEAARVQAQTEQMRSSLLSAVSHDLRTPLASITGAASTLRTQGDRLSPETRNELLESIADEAERLSRLVSNLLDMTRLESGVELRRELCPLEEIVGAALQRTERQLEGRPVTTDLPDSLPPVLVDEVLLGQLLVNLLENAAKYSPPGSAVEIAAAQAPGDGIVIEVRDRGRGFAPGEEERIFEKFYRVGGHGARGAGLGLAICKAIAEAHRGSIEAVNRDGGGAIFRVRLPVGETP